MIVELVFLIILISVMALCKRAVEPFVSSNSSSNGLMYLVNILKGSNAAQILQDKFEDFNHVKNQGKNDENDEIVRKIYYQEDKTKVVIASKTAELETVPKSVLLAIPPFRRTFRDQGGQRLVLVINKSQANVNTLTQFINDLADYDAAPPGKMEGDLDVAGGLKAATITQGSTPVLTENGGNVYGSLTVQDSMSVGSKFLVGKDNFTVTPDGRVGIKTSNPTAGLHVASMPVFNGTGNQNLSGDLYKYQNNGTFGKYNGVQLVNAVSCSIYSEGRVIIGSSELLVLSDQRSKTVLDEPVTALDIINKLKPVMYEYKDACVKQTGKKYGVVAQNVVDIFPQAVSQRRDYVCDICKPITVEESLVICAEHGLVLGDKLRFLCNNFQPVHAIVTGIVSPDKFTVNLGTQDLSQISFLYGKEVPDLLAVDYQQLFTLGLKAIQELSEKMDRQVLKEDPPPS